MHKIEEKSSLQTYNYHNSGHYPLHCLSFKTYFTDWLLSPSSGGPNTASQNVNYINISNKPTELTFRQSEVSQNYGIRTDGLSFRYIKNNWAQQQLTPFASVVFKSIVTSSPFWGGVEPSPLLLRQLLAYCTSPG
jgi:hypothetical protein